MRRIAIQAGLVLGSLLVLAAPAQATYHLNKVNEVMLSSHSGDASVQFVEFLDKGGGEELFTPFFAPYKLVIYDTAGNKLSEQTLNPNGLRAAAAVGREYLVSTTAADAAFHVTGDERLTVSLPAGGGQACFEGSPPPPAVSCLTWGTITKKVPINGFGSGSVNGPVPPAGESDQRQADGSIVAACPTAKAPNSATPCPATPPGPFAGVRFAKRRVKVDKHGNALVRLRCPSGTNGSCVGTLTLTLPGRGPGLVLGKAKFEIHASSTKTVKVSLSTKALRAIALHGSLTAVATATGHGTHTVSKTTTAELTLSRSP
jgi:hypothetical protein